MSTKVHGTTCAQAREPGRPDNGLANDVRVSPTDEGAGAAPGRGGVTRGTTTQDCSQRISSVVTPNSRKSTSFRSKRCPADPLLGAAGVGGSVAVRCHRMSPVETTLHLPIAAFAGTPSFTAASQSSSVEPSITPRTTLSARGCRQPQARREPQRRGTKAQYHSPRPGRPAPREVLVCHR